MGLNLKEYFRISLIYTLVAAFPPFIQLLIQPIIEGSGRLDAIAFSHLAILESISTLAFVLASMSIGSALIRHYYDYMDDKQGFRLLVSSCFNSILFRGLALLGIGFIIQGFIGKIFSQDELQDFSSYGFAAILIGISRAVNMTAANLFRNQKKVSHFVFLSLAMGAFRVAFQLLGLFYYEMSFIGYAYGSCVGGGIVSVGVLIYAYYKHGMKHSRTVMKPLYVFAMPLFQYAFLAWGLLFVDRYFLESQPIQLGIYDVALKFALGIEMLLVGLNGAARPELFRMMKDGFEKNEFSIKRLSNLVIAQTQVAIGVAIIPIMLFLAFFYETELKLASHIITVILMKYVLRSVFFVFSTPVYFMKLTKIFLYINIAALILNIGLNYFLIPRFGYYGAITASFAAQFLIVGLIYYYQKRKVNIKWNLNKTFYYPVMLVVFCIVIETLKNLLDWNHFMASGIVIAAIFSSLLILYWKDLIHLGLLPGKSKYASD